MFCIWYVCLWVCMCVVAYIHVYVGVCSFSMRGCQMSCSISLYSSSPWKRCLPEHRTRQAACSKLKQATVMGSQGCLHVAAPGLPCEHWRFKLEPPCLQIRWLPTSPAPCFILNFNHQSSKVPGPPYPVILILPHHIWLFRESCFRKIRIPVANPSSVTLVLRWVNHVILQTDCCKSLGLRIQNSQEWIYPSIETKHCLFTDPEDSAEKQLVGMPKIWYTKTSSCSQPVRREPQVIGQQRGIPGRCEARWHEELVKICVPAIILLIEQLHK